MTPNTETGWYSGEAATLAQTVKRLDDRLVDYREKDATLVRSFYAEAVVDLQPTTDTATMVINEAEAVGRALVGLRRFNLLRSAIETCCSMVVSVPGVEVSTVGGSYDQRKSAEALGLFVDGVFAANDMNTLAWQCVTDSMLSRVAAVMIEVIDETIKLTRILPHQIVWNALEGPNPRNLFLRRPVPKSQLLSRHADDVDKLALIKDAPPYKPNDMFNGIDGVLAESTTEMVELFEGFRLAEGDDVGHYTSCLANGAVLDDDEYPHSFHVVIPLRWAWSYSSFAGVPAGDTLYHYQEELDEISETIKEAFVKNAKLRIGIPKGAEINKDEINNMEGSYYHFESGQDLVFHKGIAPPPEYLAREEKMIERAFAFLGVSYSQASGTKADGIPSAKGQREVRDIGSHRLRLHMANLDRWHERIARGVIGVADHHFQDNKTMVVKAPGTKLLSRISWDSIDYDEDLYDVRCDAINGLSRLPAARIQEILELADAGIIDQREALRQLNVKDFQGLRDRVFSAEDLAEKLISLALSGDLRPPEVYQGERGLQTLIDKAQEEYCLEMVQDKPSGNLDKLRELIEYSKTTLDKLRKEAAARAAPPPAPPAPGAPDMLAPPGIPAGAPPDLGAPLVPVNVPAPGVVAPPPGP